MKLLIITTLLLFVFSSSAKVVEVVCPDWQNCDDLNERVKEELLEGESGLITRLKRLASIHEVNEFSIEHWKSEFGKKIILRVRKKPVIANVQYDLQEGLPRESIERLVNLSTGEYFDIDLIASKVKVIKDFLLERGFLNASVGLDVKNERKGPLVRYEVSFSEILTIKKVNLKGDLRVLPSNYYRKLKSLEKQSYNKVDIKAVIDQTKEELFLEHFFNSNLEIEAFDDDKREVEINIRLGKKTNFYFRGDDLFSRKEIVDELKKKIKSEHKVIEKRMIKKIISQMYEGRGIYETSIIIEKENGLYKTGVEYDNYRIKVSRGHKIKIEKLLFQGNDEVKLEEIKELYYSRSSDLSSRDFLDKDYIDEFSEKLKNFYFFRGYIFNKVSKPRIKLSVDKKRAEVIYEIYEKQQCLINEIEFLNLPLKIGALIKPLLVNQEGGPLNITELENDLEKALSSVRDLGYLYASIKNISKNTIIKYSSNHTEAKIVIDFELGKRNIFDSIVVSGHGKTKKRVIERENVFLKGDVITPGALESLRDRVNSLGIFSRVQVIPYIVNRFSEDEENQVSVLIRVEEKDFGSGELAPGYRTDLGAKVSFSLIRRNLWGENHSISFRTQVNRRFSLRDLDERREREQQDRIEGLVQLNYNWPYFAKFFDADLGFSVQRRRFSSFDADIWRISPQIFRQFNRFFSGSLTYQYERIRQFDATEERDRATFRIGGITPEIQADFRDNPITPRSGSLFGLSWEVANPSFGSQDDGELEINFWKFTSRNRFYYPLFDKNFVLALSLSFGYQKNFAKRDIGASDTGGSIPSIKVFRLDGIDSVRGFGDSEINRLDSGFDINTVRVENSAYFTNIKFEPRYFVNDDLIFALFFDAGKLYVNSFRPLSLRTSAGVSLKFRTPVGTLDFDYGLKTNRRNNQNGEEALGRFHLTIGFF